MPDVEGEEYQLDREACLALLQTRTVGRLVSVDPEPVAVPVNYVMTRGAVVLRTSISSKVARAVGQRVAFEVDDIDEYHRLGWSVVVHGHLDDGAALVRADPDLAERLQPWSSEAKEQWWRIDTGHVTGRWVRAGGDVGADVRGYL